MLKHFTLLLICLFGLNYGAFAQSPINDNCDSPTIIGSVTGLAFSTVNATTDGPSHPTSLGCSSSGLLPDSCSNDIWYEFTPEFTGEALFSLCGTANYDSKIIVYKPGSSCPLTDADLLACNEDGAGCDLSTSEIGFSVVQGQTYILRIGGWGGSTAGSSESGTGTFSCAQYFPNPAPGNDLCANAIELILPASESMTVDYNNQSAESDGPQHILQFCFDPNEEYVYNNVWYKYTATFTGSMEWSNCGTASLDSRVAIYESNTCPPMASELVGCSDDGIAENNTACVGYTSRAIFPVTAGKTYLISTGGWSASDEGTGTFSFKRVTAPVPPTNDNCANADSAFVMSIESADLFEYSFEGSTINASWEDASVRPSCRKTGEHWDTWFSFNSGTNTEVEIRFNSDGPQRFVLDLFSACGQPDTMVNYCLRTDSQSSTVFTDTITGLPGVPTNYLLRVGTRITSNVPGAYLFQLVGTPVAISVNEQIISAFNFSPNPVNGIAKMTFDLKKSSEGTLSITNVIGENVYQKSLGHLEAGNNNVILPLQNLDKGIYFLRLLTDNGQKTVKFIKQ
jgi:Secretion system C-terminal sorting domain